MRQWLFLQSCFNLNRYKKNEFLRSSPWMGMVGLGFLGWLVYLPGLSGGFLFDDFVNLNALGNRGPVDNWPGFWRYVTSGVADPTGRPLSLLTFLMDARDWPASPGQFLRTNVLLHLLNGTLLFALLRKLGRHIDGACVRTDATALLGAGMWLLHPLLVSTTLYIVQREAMLPATFVLLGLMGWAHGRQLHATRPRAGAAWMLAGIGFGTTLAVLSKANGMLLPLLALVLEATVLRAGDGAAAEAVAHRLRWWRRALLMFPSLLLAAWLLKNMPDLHTELAGRPWTLAERLLTQPRVLLDYLHLLLLPRVLSTGLYNDAYMVSKGLLQPASTLPALLVVIALLGASLATRRRTPVLSAGLLFWFTGHLLESTVIPLELYFEHRNYLPAMLLFWPIARLLCRWRVAPALPVVLALAILTLMAAATWQRATLWGQPQQLAWLWAQQNPDSPRSQATAAQVLAQQGRHGEALELLGEAWRARPHDPQLAFNYINSRCLSGGVSPEDVDAIANTLHHAGDGHLLVHKWLSRAVTIAAEGTCPGMDLDAAERWLNAALANSMFARPGDREQNLVPLLGELAVRRGDPEVALGYFREALRAFPNPDFAARLTTFLAIQGYPEHALELLDDYTDAGMPQPRRRGMAMLHARVLARQGFWEHEFSVLRGKLVQDIAARQDGDDGEEQPSDAAPPSSKP